MVSYDVPHFLLADSFLLLKNLILVHPILGSAGVLVLFGAILGILRLRFERLDGDIVIAAAVICFVILLLGASLLTFLHAKDFHLA